MNRRGFSLLDVVLLIGCLLLAGLIAARAPELLGVARRAACHRNQAQLAGALYQVLQERKEEVAHVATAYAVGTGRGDAPSRIVVVLTPRKGEAAGRIVVRDAPAQLLPRNVACPSSSRTGKADALVEYAFLRGRWRCLHERTHN
jgi:hypothetical protein